MIAISAAISFVGVWLGWRHQRKVTAQRATLDFITRYHIHNSDWTDNFETCRIVLRKGEEERNKLFEPPITSSKQEQLDKTYTVLNNFEAAAIGIRQRIIDEDLYKLWYEAVIISKWKLAEPFIKKTRQVNNESEYFKEFEDLATRWGEATTVKVARTVVDRVFISHVTLRRLIGVIGVTLPLVLAVCSWAVRDSISAYYYSSMRDVFVGVLFTVGFFLFCYKGYERKDDVAGDIACLSALGVALFPVNGAPVVHYLSALMLFSTLSFFSLFLFTKTHSDLPPRGRKKTRNRVYKTCGWCMVAFMVLSALASIFDWASSWNPIFWLESAMLVAFGVSWFVKGNTLLQD